MIVKYVLKAREYLALTRDYNLCLYYYETSNPLNARNFNSVEEASKEMQNHEIKHKYDIVSICKLTCSIEQIIEVDNKI